ncbi:hypothetical protein ACTFIW_000819 [Dictyostelium discoideum]
MKVFDLFESSTGRCRVVPGFGTVNMLEILVIKNLPLMVKQGYKMVRLDIKKPYPHVLLDPQYGDLFRFVWKGSHDRWKTIPLGLSTAPRIFTMLLRHKLRMLRDINISVIAYLDYILIVGSTKEEC